MGSYERSFNIYYNSRELRSLGIISVFRDFNFIVVVKCSLGIISVFRDFFFKFAFLVFEIKLIEIEFEFKLLLKHGRKKG